MCSLFPVAIPLAVCLISGAAQPATAGLTLICPVTENPQVLQLCRAIAGGLRQSGRDGLAAGGGGVQLTLAAASPRPDILTARLTVEDAQGRHPGELAELSVMDRPAIPEERIKDFAAMLLRLAGFPPRGR